MYLFGYWRFFWTTLRFGNRSNFLKVIKKKKTNNIYTQMTKTIFICILYITCIAIETRIVGLFVHVESFKNDSPYSLGDDEFVCIYRARTIATQYLLMQFSLITTNNRSVHCTRGLLSFNYTSVSWGISEYPLHVFSFPFGICSIFSPTRVIVHT